MASILKVDQIQTPSGAAPTLEGLGVDNPGSVLQVVQSVLTSTMAVGGGANTATILTATITPKNANSKIMVESSISGYCQYDTVLYWTRDNAVIGAGDPAGVRARGFGELASTARVNESGVTTGKFLDSPSTTNTLTYAVKLFNQSSPTAYINRGGADTDAAYDSRTISTLTLTEIAG